MKKKKRKIRFQIIFYQSSTWSSRIRVPLPSSYSRTHNVIEQNRVAAITRRGAISRQGRFPHKQTLLNITVLAFRRHSVHVLYYIITDTRNVIIIIIIRW